MKIGDKVIYKADDKEASGVIHGIRKAEAVTGPDIILSYLVDTGETHMDDTVVTEGKAPNIKVSQPVLIDVEPENIRLDK